MANNLSDADDRKVLSIDNNFATGSSHELSARAEKFKPHGLCGGGALPRMDGAEPRPHMRRAAYAPPQRFHQLSAVHFARGFAGRDENPHRDIVTGQNESGVQSSALAGEGARSTLIS
jgi:hypothetical protein